MMLLLDYLPSLFSGLLTTLKVTLCALGVGLLLGLLGAAAEAAPQRWLRNIAFGFHSIVRGVPELVVILFVYFAGSAILNDVLKHNTTMSPFLAGVIALGLLFGAYAAQTLRGAFAAIPSGQAEAAKAVGFSRWQTFRLILLPQAWRHALPGLGNLWLVLLKDSALVSLIGLADLMAKSQFAAINTGKPFTFYVAAAVIYLLLTSVSEIILYHFNKRANRYLAAS